MLALVATLTASPAACLRLAAAHEGAEWTVPFLDRVGELESRGEPLGLHPLDAKLGPKMHADAVRVGWLDPGTCSGHVDQDAGWSPRGPWGVAPAYSHRHLGEWACERGPEAHDHPLVAAVAAVRHAVYLSRKYGTRDPETLRHLWAGRGKPRDEVVARWRGDDA